EPVREADQVERRPHRLGAGLARADGHEVEDGQARGLGAHPGANRRPPSLIPWEGRGPPARMVAMDVPSMIMGGAIASVVWIVLVPWSRLKELRVRDQAERTEG
ncbi:MAG: hypothetical protein K0S43_965, partial [Cellulosimicrobium sp.]|nr:hypothetical protein [Cellulosimicrobium sp.]